jgi:Double-GTPase 2
MDEKIPPIKITMLGNSGAGKTCYMLGMYATMSLGVKGFTFATRDMDVDLELRDAWDQIIETEDEKRWPDPTTQTTPYEFDFCYGLDELMGFDWVDYRGGALKVSSKDPQYQSEVQGLINHLQHSDCIFLCISGEHLVGKTENNVAGVQRKTGYDRMLQFIRRLQISDNTSKPAIVIVLTKYDLVPEEKEDSITEIIKDMFNPFFTNGGNWLTMICPVTLGIDLSENSASGEIEPQNIHLPVTFAIYCAYKKLLDGLQKQERDANTRLGKGPGFWETLTGEGKYKRTKEEIERYKKRIEEMDRKMKLLVRELIGETVIYLNGEEVEIDI